MSHARIISIGRYIDADSKERMLDVEFEIVGDEAEVLSVRKLGFPIQKTQDEITDELIKYVGVFDGERSRAVEQAIIDKEDENADAIINNLVGKSL